MQMRRMQYLRPGWLTQQQALGADDLFISTALQGSTPSALAKRGSGNKLNDVAVRKVCLKEGLMQSRRAMIR